MDAAKLSAYRDLADSAPPEIAEVMLKLCDMVELFQQTPRSKLAGSLHPSGRGMIVPLEKEEVERIWDAVPWDGQKLPDGRTAPRECDMYAELFEQLPTGVEGYVMEEVKLPDGSKAHKQKPVVSNPEAKALRDAAFHLLWWAKELTLDREPLTADML